MKLKAFIVGKSDPKLNLPGCANYNREYDCCMDDGDCRVLQGERCSYFERAVLPVAKQSGRMVVIDEYVKISGGSHISFLSGVKRKVCLTCGTPVPGRHKYCEKCKKARNRDYQKQHYHKPKKLQK